MKQPPGERLFEFVSESDHFACELRFHGDYLGWEAQLLERGELLFNRGGFGTRALAVQWATEQREAIEAAWKAAQLSAEQAQQEACVPLETRVREFLVRGDKIGALRLIRAQKGLSLDEAKEYADHLVETKNG